VALAVVPEVQNPRSLIPRNARDLGATPDEVRPRGGMAILAHKEVASNP
jgi:hypothetical protein